MRIEVSSCEIADKPYFTNIEFIWENIKSNKLTSELCLYKVALWKNTFPKLSTLDTHQKGDCSENLLAQLKTLFRREGGGNTCWLMEDRSWWRRHAIQSKPSCGTKKVGCKPKTFLGTTSVYNQMLEQLGAAAGLVLGLAQSPLRKSQ